MIWGAVTSVLCWVNKGWSSLVTRESPIDMDGVLALPRATGSTDFVLAWNALFFSVVILVAPSTDFCEMVDFINEGWF